MERSGRFDPISLVEAAYRLDEPWTWLNGVTQAAQGGLDFGAGVQAGVFHMITADSNPNAPFALTPRIRPSMLAVSGTPPGMAEYLERMNDLAPLDDAIRILGAGPSRLCSFREVAAPFHFEEYFSGHPLGALPPFEDWGAVMVTEGRTMLLLGGMSFEPLVFSEADRRRWHRLAVHIAAGFRLVLQLGGVSPKVEAILEPDGRCAHAEGPARTRAAREALRDAAKRIDRARGPMRFEDAAHALEIWQGLVDGRWSLVDRFESDGRRYVVALQNDRALPDPRALTLRQRQVAHLVVEGRSNLEIAYALGLSQSVVATHVAAALRKLGLKRREELAANFPGGHSRATTAKVANATLSVISTDAAPPAIAGLSRAESEVVQGVLKGHSDARIARTRGVSPRTVANQLRSVFKKLGVQSRAELAAKVTRES